MFIYLSANYNLSFYCSLYNFLLFFWISIFIVLWLISYAWGYFILSIPLSVNVLIVNFYGNSNLLFWIDSLDYLLKQFIEIVVCPIMLVFNNLVESQFMYFVITNLFELLSSTYVFVLISIEIFISEYPYLFTFLSV